MILPALIAGGAALLGAGVSTAFAVREARKNRRFQERMSSTAHQREVADLQRAGLNPALSAMGGSGASSPPGAVAQVSDFGEAAGRGVSSALAVRAAESQIELLQAQADAARSAGLKARVEAADLQTTAPRRYTLLDAQIAVQEGNAEQIKATLPFLAAKAKAEIEREVSSARALRASAILDELLQTGAVGQQQVEELLNSGGPVVRLLLKGLGKIGPGAVGGAIGAAISRKVPPAKRITR